MYHTAQQRFTRRLETIRQQGLWQSERSILTPQGTQVRTLQTQGNDLQESADKNADSKQVLNMCANNYLGLASHSQVVAAAQENLAKYGYGLSSVRFICGTQDVHLELERQLSEFLGTEDTILYSSCFDANGGLFESLLGPEDAIISDALNHASIIDGVRLCKAQRYRYKNNDMADLERQLQEAQSAELRLVVSDGVFSMDGIIANLTKICDLAEQYDALVMVDDSHAVGFIGEHGRGTHELCGVMGRIDILTGTLGKALGGASGGYTSGRKEIVQLLRQVSRPYLFSNSLAPVIAATSLLVLDLVREGGALRQKLQKNMALFARQMRSAGFDIPQAEHPIIPVMLYDAHTATAMAEALLQQGVYVVGFTYPVVPQGKARIRVQLSAEHSEDDIERAVAAFVSARSVLKN